VSSLNYVSGTVATMDDPEVHVDYRFLLANERTFLAWMRTALGLIAGGVALDQFVRVDQGESTVIVIAVATMLAGAVVAIIGTVRWSRTDRAMRAGAPIGRTPILIVVGVLFALLAILIAMVLVTS
jgi:putative membrane protein